MSEINKVELTETVTRLPRGGYLVDTSVGYLQYGSPPETIKDTMFLSKKVPQIFLLPGELFSIEKGIAVAELEFPIYYNHFLRQSKTMIICTVEQRKQLEVVLQEAVFGPQIVDLSNEFVLGIKDETYPNLKAEMDFFRQGRELDDLVVFKHFKKIEGESNKSVFHFRDITIDREEKKGFIIFDKGKEITTLDWTLDYNIIYDIGERLAEPFKAPEFGITCLGPSHGFDPEENTSGFILWVSNRGIMIDPPVNSTEWLRDSNVNPKLIDHIILTHCHADHDAGTFQKILEEGQITIHTTETVMDSFLRKYTALTKLPTGQLYELFHFSPVIIGKSMFIEGAKFSFYYSLHSIPVIAFSVYYQNQSFLYTSDHLNHPESFVKMQKSHCFTKGRYDFLQKFPWHHKIIYHEAGIPPLHTPISYLASLPPEIQKKITVYHIAKQDFPDDTHLNIAKFGIENTLYPSIASSKYAEAIRILDVMEHIDLFGDLPLYKARKFLSIVKENNFKKDEIIVKKGTTGDTFYIIVSGNVSVLSSENNIVKHFGQYEYFGEASIINGGLRSADVVAATRVQTLMMEKEAFLNFIEGTIVGKHLQRLQKSRETNAWELLQNSSLFQTLTSYQKTQLETIMEKVTIKAGQPLIEENKVVEGAYIIISGNIKIFKRYKKVGSLSKGAFVGDVFTLQKNLPSPFTAVPDENVELYYMERQALRRFIQKNPGLYMRLLQANYDVAA